VPQAATKKPGQGKPEKKSSKVRRAAKVALKKMRAKDIQGTVSEERLFRPDGHLRRVLTLDANSPTFASDLTLIFEKNVARVRRERKKKDRAGQRA
jgi:hypothetical protein